MKISVILSFILIAGIIVISGCRTEDRELKKDAKHIAEAMCKNIEAMKNLRTADPADSMSIQKLQLEYEQVEEEMTKLNEAFRKKWEEKAAAEQFKEDFRKYLSEAMLECKSLSKEDRESFEKGMK
jgi:hypothetical protein